ncbi:MAG: CPBP family intramembrane metalloprotease [Hymenobacteraceae bacterium]|nr:CPBP family intramembrane metalloprotease [Hymenobacteraceae bacterium]
MRKIIGLLRAHLADDFRPTYYGLTALFLGAAIALNYRYDFEDSVIDAYYGREIRILWYGLFYALAYFGTVALDVWTAPVGVGAGYVRQPRFWLLSLAALAILGLDGGFYYHRPVAETLFSPATRTWGYQVLVNLNSLLTILLPCALLYRWHPDRTAGFFGLTTRHVDLRPYVGLLLVMVPLIGWASFQPDFLRTYPAYERNEAAAVWGISELLPALGFELAYGWDFIATELVFRGLLVIGLAHVMGRRAVVPMVVTYAFLHFGKPLGETIGSVFGGYILGVIALRTRNIWGGVAIHLGVAWLMEAAAFAQIGLRP